MLSIIVLLKQVLQPAALKIDRASKTLLTEGVPKVISETDKNAIEEAVRIKERHGAKVTALSMGPQESKEALREALAMGADEAILLSDPLFEGSDSHATANVLSQALQKIMNFDLIICGAYSEDLYAFQVGPRIAEILNLPQICYATKIELQEGRVKVERDLDNERQFVECNLPCLITVLRDINEPRLPTLMAILASSKKPITTWVASDLHLRQEELGFNGSLAEVLQSRVALTERKRMILQGDSKDVAQKLIAALQSEGVL